MYTHFHKWLPETKQSSPHLHVDTSKVCRQLASRLCCAWNANSGGYIVTYLLIHIIFCRSTSDYLHQWTNSASTATPPIATATCSLEGGWISVYLLREAIYATACTYYTNLSIVLKEIYVRYCHRTFDTRDGARPLLLAGPESLVHPGHVARPQHVLLAYKTFRKSDLISTRHAKPIKRSCYFLNRNTLFFSMYLKHLLHGGEGRK